MIVAVDPRLAASLPPAVVLHQFANGKGELTGRGRRALAELALSIRAAWVAQGARHQPDSELRSGGEIINGPE